MNLAVYYNHKELLYNLLTAMLLVLSLTENFTRQCWAYPRTNGIVQHGFVLGLELCKIRRKPKIKNWLNLGLITNSTFQLVFSRFYLDKVHIKIWELAAKIFESDTEYYSSILILTRINFPYVSGTTCMGKDCPLYLSSWRNELQVFPK